jgi:GGDEF domain-containing protein
VVLHEQKMEVFKMDDPDQVLHTDTDCTNLVLFLDKLNKLFVKMSHCHTANDLLYEATKILKEVLNCDNVIFMMKDEQFISIYKHENKGTTRSIYVDEFLFSIANPNSKLNKNKNN